MKEEDVISTIKGYMERQCFKVYRFRWSPLFVKFGGSPDIIGIKHGKIVSCECKGSRLVMTHTIGQAVTYRQFSDEVYIGLPSKRIDEKIIRLCKEHGIGILSVVEGEVKLISSASVKRLSSMLRKQIIGQLEQFRVGKREKRTNRMKKLKGKANLKVKSSKQKFKIRPYMIRFYERLKGKYAGSLVKVEDIEEQNAKEYLNKLAKAGLIERVRWGWYWIPANIRDPWDFFEKDKGFKIISCQTAASLWNCDFIHRDVYVLKVTDESYGKALEKFAERRGWKVRTEHIDKPTDVEYEKVDGLFVESVEETVIECMQGWAFTDAFATLYSNRDRVELKRLSKESYWKRVSGSDVRVRQALEYGCHLVNQLTGRRVFDVRETKLGDDYVKREIEEAVEKVVSLA